jgi:hypothetical protein
MNQKYIESWDKSYEKNQDEIVKHTIWKILVFPDTKEDLDKLFVTRDKLAELTKTPTTLIHKLQDQKVIYPTEYNKASSKTFLVNMKKVYCKLCIYYELTKHGYNKPEFFEWEISQHLRQYHHFDQYETSDKSNNPDHVNKYIRYQKPNLKVKCHNYQVVNIEKYYPDNPDNFKVQINLKCKDCNDEHIEVIDSVCSNYEET